MKSQDTNRLKMLELRVQMYPRQSPFIHARNELTSSGWYSFLLLSLGWGPSPATYFAAASCSSESSLDLAWSGNGREQSQWGKWTCEKGCKLQYRRFLWYWHGFAWDRRYGKTEATTTKQHNILVRAIVRVCDCDCEWMFPLGQIPQYWLLWTCHA